MLELRVGMSAGRQDPKYPNDHGNCPFAPGDVNESRALGREAQNYPLSGRHRSGQVRQKPARQG